MQVSSCRCISLNRTRRSRQNRIAEHLACARISICCRAQAVCQVGRVTPCAPQTRIRSRSGAHGVTRPTLLALRQAAALACNEISVLSDYEKLRCAPSLAPALDKAKKNDYKQSHKPVPVGRGY